MFEEFYQKYETEEQEVIALIRKCIGAGYHKSDNSDFWEMTVITLGISSHSHLCRNYRLWMGCLPFMP